MCYEIFGLLKRLPTGVARKYIDNASILGVVSHVLSVWIGRVEPLRAETTVEFGLTIVNAYVILEISQASENFAAVFAFESMIMQLVFFKLL